jgi:hypothetical protein
MKALFKGCRYQPATEEIQAMMLALTKVAGNGLKKCFELWFSHWQKTVDSHR